MKSPLWENSPGALTALINTGKFVYANMLTISFNSSSDFVPHKLTEDFGPYPWAPDSSFFLSGIGTFYRIDPATGLKTLVLDSSTGGLGFILQPSISPDGTKFVFVNVAVHNELWTANIDGSGLTKIYTDTADDGIDRPHWGSNDVIVFASPVPQQLKTINPNGSGLAPIATTTGVPSYPTWSPDATQIAFMMDRQQIWKCLADGSGLVQLTNYPLDGWALQPSWSPNGSRIIYTATNRASNTISGQGIWTMNQDGSDQRKIYTPVNMGIFGDGFSPQYATFSPDGNWVVYTNQAANDLSRQGTWVFRTPVPLKLREGMAVTPGQKPIDPIYLTDGDINIKLYDGSPVWDANAVRIDRANSQMNGHWKRGLNVDTSIIVLAPRLSDGITGAEFPDKIGDIPWVEAARGGVFGAVDVQIDRAYFASWGDYALTKTPVGALTIFAGNAAEVDLTDTMVVLTLNDGRELFTTIVPPTVFEAQCRHTLFGPGCGLLRANFSVTGSVIAGSTKSVLATTTIVPSGSGTFAQGRVTMTSGLNNGFSRTIVRWTAPDTLALLSPFPFAVEIGDTFVASPGCNKTLAACVLFNNKDRYGGFPFIPTAATAI